MNSSEIKQCIREYSNIFWYTPEDKREEISTEFLAETILNYGDKDGVYFAILFQYQQNIFYFYKSGIKIRFCKKWL